MEGEPEGGMALRQDDRGVSRENRDRGCCGLGAACKAKIKKKNKSAAVGGANVLSRVEGVGCIGDGRQHPNHVGAALDVTLNHI